MSLTRPMLAAAVDRTDNLPYPLLCTPKLDGIRCLIVGGQAVSRTFKPIRNMYIQQAIKNLQLPDGFDGELFAKDLTFQQITSIVMTEIHGAGSIQYWVFDWYSTMPYFQRCGWYEDECIKRKQTGFLIPLSPTKVYNEQELLAFEQKCLEDGFEGICMRTPSSPYKCGRSTLKEGWLLKLKRFIDEEATIVGFEEEMENQNEKTRDNFGLSERSSHQDNLIPKGTLGSFIVQSSRGQYKVGSGFTAAQRKEFWERKDTLTGKNITVKFFPIGIKDLPRHPVFKGFREDI